MMPYLPSRCRVSLGCLLCIGPSVLTSLALPAIASAPVTDKTLTAKQDFPRSRTQIALKSSTLGTLSARQSMLSPPEILLDGDRLEFSGQMIKSSERLMRDDIKALEYPEGMTELSQLPAPVAPIIKPQLPSPPPNPKPLPSPEIKDSGQKGKTVPPQVPDALSSQSITVEKFQFSDGVDCDSPSTSKLEAEVKDLKLSDLINTEKYLKKLQISGLIEVATVVAKAYAEKGYRTSGAVVCIPRVSSPDTPSVVTIRIIKGNLTAINVTLAPKNDKGEPIVGSRPPLEAYIKARLGIVQSQPLNIDKLQEALQLLQFDGGSLFDSVTGQLSSGVNAGESILNVTVTPKKRTFGAVIAIDNGRVPSVGDLQQRVTLRESNLLGFGDSLSASYARSEGSNSWDFSYVVPISPRNTTLSLNYSRSGSSVIEAPFDDLDGDGRKGDIKSSSQSYEISLRHPLIRSITRPRSVNEDLTGAEREADSARYKKEEARGSVFREFAIGVTGSLRNSQTSLLGIPFPLSSGANEDGFTRIAALRFFQEFTQQDAREVWFLRSQFNFGLNAFGSTINQPIFGLNDPAPDSRFFSWLGQAQWTRRLGNDAQKSPLLTLRSNVQLADRTLVSSEQFSLGGFGTVRGYRQDILQSDSGVFATAELQIPIARIGKWQQGAFQIVPFVDYGMGWNSTGKAPTPSSLLSTGLGLRFQYDQFSARLDWGIPLTSVESRGKTWQDNGIHFSLQWNGF